MPNQGGMVAGNISSAGQEFRETARLGEAMSETGKQFAEAMTKATYTSELNSAKVRMHKSFNDLDMEIAQDPDHTTYTSRFTKGRDAIEKDLSRTFTTETARKDFSAIFNETAETRRHAISTLVEAKKVQKLKDDLDFSIKEAVLMGDEGLVDEVLQGAQTTGAISEGKAKLKRLESIQNINYTRAKTAGLADPGATLVKIQQGEYALEPDIELKLTEHLMRAVEKIDKDTEKLRKQAETEAQKRVMDFIDKDDFENADQWIEYYSNSRILDPETRKSLRKMLDEKEESSVDSVLDDLGNRILDPDDNVKNSEILNTIGIGFKDKKYLMELNDSPVDDPRKGFEYKEVYDSLRNEISPRGPMGQVDMAKESRWTACKRAFDRFVKDDGDPWEFYDKNLFKYQMGIPTTRYGKPKTVEEVKRFKLLLIEDRNAGTITAHEGDMEAGKLEDAEKRLIESERSRSKDAKTKRQ